MATGSGQEHRSRFSTLVERIRSVPRWVDALRNRQQRGEAEAVQKIQELRDGFENGFWMYLAERSTENPWKFPAFIKQSVTKLPPPAELTDEKLASLTDGDGAHPAIDTYLAKIIRAFIWNTEHSAEHANAVTREILGYLPGIDPVPEKQSQTAVNLQIECRRLLAERQAQRKKQPAA